MSGRARRILFFVVSAALLLAAVAGACLLLYFYAHTAADYALFSVAMLCELLGIPVLFHETGHLLFGLLAGLRPVSFSFGWITVEGGHVRFGMGQGAGETRMLPRRPENVRAKLAFFSLGGVVSDLLIGALLLLLFFLLPFRSVLLFFAELSLFFLAEGLRALLPAELPAGLTDGAFFLGLIKKTSETEVALRAMTAQGMLYRLPYEKIPRELLFDAPVVREDLPAFLALSELRWQYLLAVGETEAAFAQYSRFSGLMEYLPAEARGEVLSDMALAARAEGWAFPGETGEVKDRADGKMYGLKVFREGLAARAAARERGEK